MINVRVPETRFMLIQEKKQIQKRLSDETSTILHTHTITFIVVVFPIGTKEL